MKTFYKATRPDGTDFRTGKVDYLGALASGERIKVGSPTRKGGYECCTGDVLIGTARFTQDHYDLVTGPWRRTIGPLHPDDDDLMPQGQKSSTLSVSGTETLTDEVLS